MGNDIRSEAMRAFFSVIKNAASVQRKTDQRKTDQQETECVT